METRICQNCKSDFTIESDDFAFYEKIKVPPPTFCPECRYKRRIVWRNARLLFRGKDALSGKEIFTGIPPEAGLTLYEQSYWNSDSWDSLSYAQEFDSSQSFLSQFYTLYKSVPYPAKSMQRCIDSDYSNMCDDMKNTYMCFNATFVEDSAYCCNASHVKNSFDLTSGFECESCYENIRVDKSYNVVGSLMSENCVDMWFSKNCVGCNNCLGCVNLRNASYRIFNEQYTKEEYEKQLASFQLDTSSGFSWAKEKAHEFWNKFPIKYMLGFRNVDVVGEDIKDSKNVKYSYIVKKGENLKYVQDVPFGGASNSYDYTSWGVSASLMYECMICGEQAENIKFCFECWPGCQDLEYCINMRRSKNCFGCVGMKDKQYCILNKQYTKEEYINVTEKIRAHMMEIPFTDKRGNVFRYGEFFPVEFSPFAYNQTILNDQFPSDEATVRAQGFLWKESDRRDYEITLHSGDVPDSIHGCDDSLTREILGCEKCKKAYRIIPDELSFLKRMSLPLPRLCPECRFQERQKFMAPPVLKEASCACFGKKSKDDIYANTEDHVHGQSACGTQFLTAYNPVNEIIYCEECYKKEVF